MTTLSYTRTLQKTALASMMGLYLSTSAFALEALSDDHLSETTGEGIAMLPQDAYFVFRGAGANESTQDIAKDRSKDTGYFHYIPVGPLTVAAQDTNKDGVINANDQAVGKADLYLYGLALSKSDNDSNTRFAATEDAAKIRSWGTAANPWVLNVETETNVPNFSSRNCSGAADPACQVSYMSFEAPLYEVGTRDAAGADAYQLKLATWLDAFVLDQNKPVGDSNLYHLGEKPGTSDPTRANRLRLQAIWNNFSVNGSRVQVFQTLGGAGNSDGMSVFYNNTLGVAALLRLNSGDGNALRSNSGTQNVLRLSTREISSSNSKNLETPAMHQSSAPSFDPNEGLFIQNLNANIVLGSLYQPLILGSDGKNFSLELARIPNKAEIYRKIYIDYDNPASDTYTGSVCNIYQCGSNGLTGYQGNNATHSSISIGSTVYDRAKNQLSAYKGADAIGVSFAAPTYLQNQMPNPNMTPKNMGSGVIDGVLIQHMKITTKGL